VSKWEYMLVLSASPGGGWMDARRSGDLQLITAASDLVALLSEVSRDGWEPAEMLMPDSQPDRVIFQRRRLNPPQAGSDREPLVTAVGSAFA
jgi:hypothetical protein